MAAEKFPVTPAVRVLRAAGIDHHPALYDYVDKGGTARAAAELGVDEHAVVKTIVLEDESGAPLIMLQHGDREVAVGLLAKAAGVKRVAPCAPEVAQRHTGYLVGGTSPLGTRRPIPVYAQESLFALEAIWINGGKRGFLVRLAPADLRKVLEVRPVDASSG